MFCLTLMLNLPDKRYVYAFIFHSSTCLEIYYLNFCFSSTILRIPCRVNLCILHDYHLPLETLNLPISFSSSILHFVVSTILKGTAKNSTSNRTNQFSHISKKNLWHFFSQCGIWVERVSNKNWNKISLSWNYFLSQVFCKWKHFWLSIIAKFL